MTVEKFKQMDNKELKLYVGGENSTVYEFGRRIGQDISDATDAIVDGAVSACQAVNLCDGN